MRREYPTGDTKPEITLTRADLDWIQKYAAETVVNTEYSLALTLRPVVALREFLKYRGIKVNWNIGDMNE